MLSYVHACVYACMLCVCESECVKMHLAVFFAAQEYRHLFSSVSITTNNREPVIFQHTLGGAFYFLAYLFAVLCVMFRPAIMKAKLIYMGN